MNNNIIEWCEFVIRYEGSELSDYVEHSLRLLKSSSSSDKLKEVLTKELIKLFKNLVENDDFLDSLEEPQGICFRCSDCQKLIESGEKKSRPMLALEDLLLNHKLW